MNRKINRLAIVLFFASIIVFDSVFTITSFPVATRFYEHNIGYDSTLVDWLHGYASRNSNIGVLSNDFVGEWLNVYGGYRTWSYPALIYLDSSSYFSQSQAISRILVSYYSANATGLSLNLHGDAGRLTEDVSTATSNLSVTFDSVETFNARTLYLRTAVSSMNGSSRFSPSGGNMSLALKSSAADLALQIVPSAKSNSIVESLQANSSSGSPVSQLAFTLSVSGYAVDSSRGALTLSSPALSVEITSSNLIITNSGDSLSIIATPTLGTAGPIWVDFSMSYGAAVKGPFTFFFLPDYLAERQIPFVVCGQPYCESLAADLELFGALKLVYQDGVYQVYGAG